MKNKSIITFVFFPSIFTIAILICSSMAINHGWELPLEDTGWMTDAGIFVRILFLYFGTYIIYPFTFYGRIQPGIRVFAAYTPHFYWFFYQVTLHAGIYPAGELLYTIFNPVFLFFIARTVFQVGLVEIICRWICKNRVSPHQKLPLPLLWIISGISMMLVMAWFAVPFVRKYRNLYELLLN